MAVGVQALRSNLYVKEDNENCGDDASLLGMCGCGFGSGIVTAQRDSVQIPEWLENVWKNSQSESEGNQDEGSVVLVNIIIHHVYHILSNALALHYFRYVR